jgi:hypothetical protein
MQPAIVDYALALQKSLPKLNVLKKQYAEVKIKELAVEPGQNLRD